MGLSGDTKARKLGLFFLAIVAVWIAMNTASGLLYSLESERWPLTSAQVVNSGLYVDGSNVSRGWEPTVVYKYKIDNRTFTSGRVRFLMGPLARQEEASQIVDSYRVGRVVPVAYNPANPNQSVLE